MWNSTWTTDVNSNDVPVRQLRKPPSQRGNSGSQAAPRQNSSRTSVTGEVQTSNLDPYGWASIWLLIGFQLHGGNPTYFYGWACVTAILILVTKAQYFIGAAALLFGLYFGFQTIFI
jgi:hypothetical protein